jgi:hypothetical protein
LGLRKPFSIVHSPQRRIQLSLSLEATVFGAIALGIFYIAVYKVVLEVLGDIKFIISLLSPREPPKPFPPYPFHTHLMIRVAVVTSAYALLPILGLYSLGTWAMKGFLETSPLPIILALLVSLLYSIDTITIGGVDGYAILIMTIIPIVVAVRSRGVKYWITPAQFD